ncbi:hypothetical protein O181_045865 [Austropuccinia psidii MF-1]|uniref:Reverse transcriptase/retrotransposon-derived protein RNase H-like domain-containing protein n=1 Tax=Austropuccinia psidii MF-1 TaxID=1389203 RepID=A0A9Q3DS76_9BASI|nr:hypothetical protein [Austropuccinia psidii MF-1]
MKVSSKKFHFGLEELKAQGHVVSSLSLGIEKNKFEVLLKPIPQRKKEIHSALELAGYYRQHIKDFESISRPIDKFCDKDTEFLITAYRVQAFESLTKALTTAPLLLMPDFNLPFKLYIDASGDGLGAELNQVHIINDEPMEGHICFISRKINPTKARYGEIHMAFLCFVCTLEKLN